MLASSCFLYHLGFFLGMRNILVVWNIWNFTIYWEQSSHLTNIFQRGRSTTNQYHITIILPSYYSYIITYHYHFTILLPYYQPVSILMEGPKGSLGSGLPVPGRPCLGWITPHLGVFPWPRRRLSDRCQSGKCRFHLVADIEIYPLVNIQKAIENGHRNSGFSH